MCDFAFIDLKNISERLGKVATFYTERQHIQSLRISLRGRERWEDAFLSQQIAVAHHLQVIISTGSKGTLTLFLKVWINIKSVLEQENTLHYIVKWMLSHWKIHYKDVRHRYKKASSELFFWLVIAGRLFIIVNLNIHV